MAQPRNTMAQPRNTKPTKRNTPGLDATLDSGPPEDPQQAQRSVLTPRGKRASVREAARQEGVAASTITRRAKKGGSYRYA